MLILRKPSIPTYYLSSIIFLFFLSKWAFAGQETRLDISPSEGNVVNGIVLTPDGSTLEGVYVSADDKRHIYRWNWSGGITDLATIPGVNGAIFRSSNVLNPVGAFQGSDGRTHVFRWTQDAGIQELGEIDSNETAFAYNASADGLVVTGGLKLAPPKKRELFLQPFRWTPAQGVKAINVIDRYSAATWQVAKGGSEIAGTFLDDNSKSHVFTWAESSGVREVGIVPFVPYIRYGNNGSLIVAYVDDSGIAEIANLAAGTDHPIKIGSFEVGGKNAIIAAVSEDGTAATGMFLDAATFRWHAFYWTRDGGMEEINFPPSVITPTPTTISADGSVVAGTYSSSIDRGAHSHTFATRFRFPR